MKKKKNKKIIVFVIITIIAVIMVIGFCQTNIKISQYTYSNPKIPKEFDGYKILVISDLHVKNFGKNQKDLIEAIKGQNPDMIALTGDIVDEDHYDLKSVDDLLKNIGEMAPVYYVTGNHELDLGAKSQVQELNLMFIKYGVTCLDGETVEIKKNNSSIYLTGVGYTRNTRKKISMADKGKFNILMFHPSSQFDEVSTYGYDIVLSGHAHGGIIRLPFIGGVIANDHSLFPKYDGGVFEKNGSTLFSSNGLGDSEIPRFNNPPELVVITLNA